MKKKIILATILLSFNTAKLVAEDTITAPKVWIGVEYFVENEIAKKGHGTFEYSNNIKGINEIFYQVKESDLDNISRFIHQALKRCGGFRLLSHHPMQEPKRITPQLINFLDYSIDQETTVNSWFPQISLQYMNEVVTKLTAYHTRYYKSQEGVEALKWIGSEWERLVQNRNDVRLEYYQYQNHQQPTVILTVEGSDPILKDQIIILGGHGDSINTDNEGPHTHAPGADDNAAGIAVLSEIIRIMADMNYRPRHTIQFIAYAAEEVGIQGSYELARVYRENQIKVIGVIQFDGVNYNQLKTFDMALISDSTNKEQNIFLAQLLDKYLQVSWSWEQCGYGCSDHAAWNYEGYRASFPVEAINQEQNPFIHTIKDTFDKSDYSVTHASLFTRLGIAYLIELDQ